MNKDKSVLMQVLAAELAHQVDADVARTATLAVRVHDRCYDVRVRRSNHVPPQETDPNADYHYIALDDTEHETLLEMLRINDAHFETLTHEGVIVADVPQTENIVAYRKILQRIITKAEAC